MPIRIQTKNREKKKKGFRVITKIGDDLKQDILIYQIIKLFDNWWLEAGLDLKVTPYSVMATQDMFGFIEFVEGATVADIVAKQSTHLSSVNDNS